MVSMPEIFRWLSEPTIWLLIRVGSSSKEVGGKLSVSSTLLTMYAGGDLGSRMTSSILPSTPDVGPKLRRLTVQFLKGIMNSILVFDFSNKGGAVLYTSQHNVLSGKMQNNSSLNAGVATLWS